jgi:hypothetical protein
MGEKSNREFNEGTPRKETTLKTWVLITMDLEEIGWQGVSWIHLAQDSQVVSC